MTGITLAEIQGRREKLVEKIWEAAGRRRHLVIIPSAKKKFISGKIPYVFRQNTDFMYLTGNCEYDSCLVLEIEANKFSSTIFVRPKNQHTELWDGVVTGLGEGAEFFGVDQAVDINELSSYISLACKSEKPDIVWYNAEESEFSSVSQVVSELVKGITLQSPTNLIHRLRVLKSAAEQNLMRKTCEIAAQAINETRQWTQPGMSEHHLFAKVDYECRIRDAAFLAYPPVVAGGSNGTTIHYINNCQTVNEGEMVLMDAGCEYGSYTSDITRTFPVGRSFTDPQRVLYEIVLDTQKGLCLTTLF